jgi:hypothetical protein
MSFQITPARSSRVTKSRRPTASSTLGLRRSTSSLSSSPRSRRSSQSSKLSVHDENDGPLDDTGVIASLVSDLNFRDIPQYMQYIRDSMFSPIPDKGAGMNSTRIAEVLNYRKNLPGIVTVAHIDALGHSSTKTEREIAELAQAGIVRRVTIPHQGAGAAAVGDGSALVSEWQQQVRSHPDMSPELQCKHLYLPFYPSLTVNKPSIYPS